MWTRLKKADRVRHKRYIAAEPNRRKCLARNCHGHVITLPMALPEAEISAVREIKLLYSVLAKKLSDAT